MEIVQATPAHLPEIVALWTEFFEFLGHVDHRFTRSEDAPLHFRKYVRELMTSDESRVLVGMEKDRVVAYSISQIKSHPPVFPHGKYGFISDIGVRQEFQGRGFGEQMLGKIFEWFEAKGVKRIELRVAAKNHAGRSFWRKHGFKAYLHILCMERLPDSKV